MVKDSGIIDSRVRGRPWVHHWLACITSFREKTCYPWVCSDSLEFTRSYSSWKENCSLNLLVDLLSDGIDVRQRDLSIRTSSYIHFCYLIWFPEWNTSLTAFMYTRNGKEMVRRVSRMQFPTLFSQLYHNSLTLGHAAFSRWLCFHSVMTFHPLL